MAAAVLAGVSLVATSASAEPVTATGKGIAGGVLLGAELGMIPQGIAGVDKWWTYLLGGTLGAAAGGVGGYFVEQNATTAEPALYMLAGGMALVIPTVVVTLNATSYKPEVEEGEVAVDESASEGTEPTPEASPEAAPGDGAPSVAPAPSPTAPAPQSALRRKSRRPAFAPSLIGLDFTGSSVTLRPGIPAVDVRPLYSMQEAAQYGIAQGTQVMVPALSGRF